MPPENRITIKQVWPSLANVCSGIVGEGEMKEQLQEPGSKR